MTWSLEDGRLLGSPAQVLREFVLAELARCQLDVPAAPVSFAQDGSGLVAVTIDRLPAVDEFHYLAGRELLPQLSIGSIVRVPFRGRQVCGWITGFPDRAGISGEKLRMLKAILGNMPVFGREDLAAARVISRYYLGGLWQILRHFQPPGRPSGVRVSAPFATSADLRGEICLPRVDLMELAPTDAASSSLSDLVYACTASRRSAVVVDPVAPAATAAELRSRGVSVVEPAACRTQGQLRSAWVSAASRRGVAVVGGRSTVFYPAGDLGLFVVVDETNPSLKEQASPCYHAREAAVIRAACLGADVVLMSASPSPEARIWASAVTRPDRNILQEGWPAAEVIMRQHEPPSSGTLSEAAVARVRRVLERDGRVLLFLNRAGEARATRCGDCLRLRTCVSCGGALIPEKGTPLGQDKRLECASCQAKLAVTCTYCGSARIKRLGAGTRSLAREAGHLFSKSSISVIDRESTPGADVADVLVGTEAAFWRAGVLDLVVIVDLDSLLLAPDAMAVENAWRLVTRAAAHAPARSEGRPYAGMLIQTYMTHLPFGEALIKGDSEAALREVLEERDRVRLPPFTRCARIGVTGESSSTWAQRIAQMAGDCGAQVLGPDESSSTSKVLVLSSSPAEVWEAVASGATDARSAGCKVRIEVDPARLE